MLGIREYITLAVIFIANFLQGITGFAGSFLTMPPAIQMIGADEARILVAFIAQISSVMILATGLSHVRWRECVKVILIAALGMAFGILIFEKVDLRILLVLYGILIIVIAVKHLLTDFLESRETSRKGCNAVSTAAGEDGSATVSGDGSAQAGKDGSAAGRLFRFELDPKSRLMIVIIFAAGILNGVFLSGGALLVVYATRAMPKKEEMRVTLAVIWIVLDSFITVPGAFAGEFTPKILLMSAIATVLLLIATWAGTKVMKRISQETFMRITYVLLLAAGIIVFI